MTLDSALVTGASGFIGSHLVCRLVDAGVRTYALTRSGRRGGHQSLSGAQILRVRSYSAPELGRALAGVQSHAVFHLAACGVQQGESTGAILDGNIRLMADLLQVTRRWPLRCFVYTGSCSEYGDCPGGVPRRETGPLAPRSAYGIAKAAATQLGEKLATWWQLPFVCLRLFGVYGPGEGPQRLLPAVIENLSRGRPVRLSPGTQVRDFTYVGDVVEALLAAVDCPRAAPHSTYNVCSGRGVTVRHVAETAARRLGGRRDLLRWGSLPLRPGETAYLVGDPGRFAEVTGWRPRVDLEAGIAQMIDGTPLETGVQPIRRSA